MTRVTDPAIIPWLIASVLLSASLLLPFILRNQKRFKEDKDKKLPLNTRRDLVNGVLIFLLVIFGVLPLYLLIGENGTIILACSLMAGLSLACVMKWGNQARARLRQQQKQLVAQLRE